MNAPLPESIRKALESVKAKGMQVTEVLELEITPNRPDALSHVGIAREVAAILGVPFRLPALLVLKQPDLGTALVILSIGCTMVLFARVRWRTVAVLVGVAALGATLEPRFVSGPVTTVVKAGNARTISIAWLISICRGLGR